MWFLFHVVPISLKTFNQILVSYFKGRKQLYSVKFALLFILKERESEKLIFNQEEPSAEPAVINGSPAQLQIKNNKLQLEIRKYKIQITNYN